jgi:hypothetical protein
MYKTANILSWSDGIPMTTYMAVFISCYFLHFLNILFYHENGGSGFIRNAGTFSPNHRTSDPRREYIS